MVGIWDGMLRRGMSNDDEWGGGYMGMLKGRGRGGGE